MKSYIPVIALLVIVTSCKNAETKADATEKTSVDTAQKISDEKMPTSRGGNLSVDTNATVSISAEILANIDKHIITEAVYPAAGENGGIVNGTITIKNTLTNATIQKAIVEALILQADGKEFRTDYHTVINIESGQTKTIKMPTIARGVKVTTRIVKLKSDDLTNGEMILVGGHYLPK